MASGPPQPRESEKTRSPLRIVYMGTPELAALILERVLAGQGGVFTVVGVVTQPDRPRGRGLRLEASAVGRFCERRRLPCLKPEKIRTAEFLGNLKAFDPDLLVVAAYGRILPNSVLEAPRLMPLNVHASLLPRHRGAAPIEGAILAGDSDTGVTIMRITERMDAGGVLLARSIPIAPDDTQGTLKTKLAELGAEALIEVLVRLGSGTIEETPQDESRASYTKPIKRDDSVIDWTLDAVQIERMMRAFDPWPVARTRFASQDLLVYRARVGESATGDAPPGTIVEVEPLPLVMCGRGMLALLEVQAAGRKRMTAADFMRGRRVKPGELLGR